MWALCVLLCCVGCSGADGGLGEKGRAELRRLRGLATHAGYGACWARALEGVHARCAELTAEAQGAVALAFTHCHLRRSGRSFPECPDGSSVKTCTRDMDPVAFNTFTEFFTHAHSICHYLQSEKWQNRAENTIHRLTESSAGVAEQLASTQKMAEDLVEAQSMALRSQETILRNGEELKSTLQHSTKGLRDVFAEMKTSVREQQVAFGEVFNRVAFLQSFIVSESHTLGSLFYNALGFCASFVLTSMHRTSGARLFLFGLVALNVYLERLVTRMVLENDNPGYQQVERVTFLVGLLRRAMMAVGCGVLLYFALRFRSVDQESLEILRELRVTHASLKSTLREAKRLSGSLDHCTRPRLGHTGGLRTEEDHEESSLVILHPSGALEPVPPLHGGRQHECRASPLGSLEVSRKSRRCSSGPRVRDSAVVYSVLVEGAQPRYSLRSRRSLCAPEPGGK